VNREGWWSHIIQKCKVGDLLEFNPNKVGDLLEFNPNKVTSKQSAGMQAAAGEAWKL